MEEACNLGGGKASGPARRRRASDLSREEVTALYRAYPLSHAASVAGCGVTALKRRCRELGIMKWPYRQLSSLAKLSTGLAAEAKDGEGLAEVLEAVEHEKARLAADPSAAIPATLKKLRQVTFKSRHAKGKNA